jgi:hypothetical protein
LKEKIEMSISDGQKEVTEFFKSIHGEPPIKINLLMKQLNIMSNNREIKFILSNKAKDINEKFTASLKK